jgi:pimeloyl-ACP methyl ester carboxylesterase
MVVLVAPMIPAPGESPGEWWEGSGQTRAQRELDEREGRDPDAPFDWRVAFMHDVPDEIVEEAAARGEPRQADKPFGEPWPLNKWPDVPTKVIAARNDRLFPLEFMRRLSQERLGVEPAVIDSGHLPALARPAELAKMLETCAR